ncbi:non-structural maintenance of chromosomes element 3 homolog isoform X1 [Microcaecilia unicolor]|uniref:Non-structural maintenance of chromosomes element 3 homolog isoform X1 n=1 Tax=Microcaecilia unicolor TaxID=1415580 RepID=A0A6P7X9A4_9AMPH|nr:non-structural maintenance of chromosomes element 3 homolog isoform X1 [Microcaecilia unicolor]XP_030049896.1 non-structural maintenance of chromosomes element 3 homolog isoform X1 [Microcaecilia unicolor]
MEECSFTQTQTPSQVRRNLEKRSPEQVDQKVGEVLQYLLVKDQKKLPIKRADIMKSVVKEYKDVYPEIMNRVGRTLQQAECRAAEEGHLSLLTEQVFGLQLEEVDTKNHIYILVNRLQRVEGDNMRVDDNTGKLGLLTVILSLIFMKGNVAKESVIWETLRRLRLDHGEKNSEFGDLKKLVTEEFVRQKYLEYTRIPHTEPVEYEFRWGPRAVKETSKMKILEFVSKIQNKDPQSWVTHYKEAMDEAATPARH